MRKRWSGRWHKSRELYQLKLEPPRKRHLEGPTKLNQVSENAASTFSSNNCLVPTPTPIPTLDAAILRIDRTLNAMTTSHTQNATSIASLTEEHLAYDNEEADLRRQVSLAEEKRAWFQQFHERMENIGEFLEEKVCFGTFTCGAGF